MTPSDTLVEIQQFMRTATPSAWLRAAIENLTVLLIDHAQCEQKAAASAMRLIHRYPGDLTLCLKMSRLAREEMRHFEQVLGHLQRRGESYASQSASRYASGLLGSLRHAEPQRKTDLLLIGALIEARSCERFAALAPLLEQSGETELACFYQGLLASEGRHYQDYLKLAYRETPVNDVAARLEQLLDVENTLITAADSDLRFHSGPPG